MATANAEQLRLTSIPTNYSLETLHPPKKKSYERVPRSMKSNFYLTHPDLTKGQKRYLWSTCAIYSTAQMKQVIQDQFVRQLFYEMRKGIIRSADWMKYLEYILDPKKRKSQFQNPSPKMWKAPPDQFKFKYYRDHPVDIPHLPVPPYVGSAIRQWTRSPTPPEEQRYVPRKRKGKKAATTPNTKQPSYLNIPADEKRRLLAALGSNSSSEISSPSYSLTFTSLSSSNGSQNSSDGNQESEKIIGEGLTRPKSRIGRRLPGRTF